jgi:hypothetical protein
MNNEAHSKEKTTTNEEMDTSTADRGIIPSEVAARMDKEGDDYRTTADEQAPSESIDVTAGATVDQEGLANNFAVEPDMYYETPGDMQQQEDEDAAARTEELAEANEDKEGQLTMEGDQRGRGPGII